MNGKELLDKMEFIDLAFIEAADMELPKRKKTWIKWSVLAASFALIMYIGINFYPKSTPDNESELPKLSISEHASGMGYEGYMAYDVSELVNENPWNENAELSTLPVYQNPLTYDKNAIACGADFDKMRDFLIEISKRLGLNVNKLTITDDTPNEETKKKIIEKFQQTGNEVPKDYFNPTKLIIETEGITIEVDQTMTAHIYFEPAVSLPSKYNFADYASYEDIVDVAEYLKSKYKNLIGIDNPQINIHGGDYNIYPRQKYYIEFFDASGNDTVQIINYNFNRITFYSDDDGKLFIARIFQPDLSKKVGDYPIINAEQAKELLLKGNYLTTVPHEISDSEYIKKVELIYRMGELDAYYMPYYRFYIELPEEAQENGLKTYGAYYVPAVDSAYLSNMPSFTTQ